MSYATGELMKLDDPRGWRLVDIDLGQQDGKRLKFIGIVKDVGDGTLQARGIFKIGSSETGTTAAERAAPASSLPDWEDLRGRAPNATGSATSEEFVRELLPGYRICS